MPATRFDPINAMSVVTAFVLVLGAILAAMRADIYWTAVALWAAALIILPYFRYRGRERSFISGLMPLVALPYIASYLSGGSSGLLPMTSPWYLLLSSIAIFSLCLVTIALINSTSGMKLNLKFAMQVAFMFYVSMIAMQAPIFYYSDLWLGTSMMPNNHGLMSYITLATINGLLMTVFFYAGARTIMLRRSEAREASE